MDFESFILSLELEDRALTSSYSADGVAVSSGDAKVEGFVDDGSLVFFGSELQDQQKEDVLYSTFLSQLAANKKYNRFTETEDWYKFYTNVMETLGWVIPEYNFKEYSPSQSSFKLSNVVLTLLNDMIGHDTEIMEAVKETIENMQTSSSAGVSLFNSSSFSKKSGNFQVLSCSIDKSNQVSMCFLGLYFQAEMTQDDFFFAILTQQDIRVFASSQVLVLDEDQYGQVRDYVKKKLGDRIHKQIYKFRADELQT